MAEGQPMWMQALCYSYNELRSLANVCGEGVIDVFGGSLLVASSGAADHSVTIAAGSAWVEADGINVEGMYRVPNDGPVTVQLDAGGGGNPRVDTIVATVKDSQSTGVDNLWTLQEPLVGTPDAAAALTDAGIAASAAAVPDNTVVLAYVLVPAADTLTTTISGANILDARNNYLSCDVDPFVQLVATAVTAITPASTFVKVNLATTVHIDRDFFSVASSIVTVKQAGLYDVGAYGGFSGGLAGDRFLSIGKNGTTDRTIGQAGVVGSTQFVPTVSGIMIPLAANDTIQLCAEQSGQASLDTLHSASTVSRLTIRKVG